MYILAIDQGTTSTRSIIFNKQAKPISMAQLEIEQHYPHEAWVEHDPENIWQTVVETIKQSLANASLSLSDIQAIGISNQRETTVLWDKETGKPVYPAIVWQDRRTHEFCQQLIQQDLTKTIHEKTGLLIDPYFSASKIKWILDNVPEAKSLLEKNKLLFGTIDTYLIWRLTGGKSHVTDITNASRTMLCNIQTKQWDEALLSLFSIPDTILPKIIANNAYFGATDASLFGASIPIHGSAGDQQAAAIGQCCFDKGMLKSTYGTGCFLLLNTGEQPVYSTNRLLTTIAYQIDERISYGLEGSIFVAGAAVQWLRDTVNLISHASETEAMALNLKHNEGVYLVPAFTGLGAPYWDPLARGAILGLTRNTGVEHIVRAALEAVCYQTKDLIVAMEKDGALINNLRVDGGMVANNWLMQFLADIINLDVFRPSITETSALGACYLAGLGCGIFNALEDIQTLWQEDTVFAPKMLANTRDALYKGWLTAVDKIRVIN